MQEAGGPTLVSAAIEGLLDEAVVRRLVGLADGDIGTVHGKRGKGYLRANMSGFNNAARFTPWLVIADLNAEADCAPTMHATWLPAASAGMCFRVAVRTIEGWLIADRESLAGFLSISVSRVTQQVETLPDPKAEMIMLAGRSRRRDIREDMVPRVGGGGREGPAYTSRMIEYVNEHWRPRVAAEFSDSLARAIRAIDRLIVP